MPLHPEWEDARTAEQPYRHLADEEHKCWRQTAVGDTGWTQAVAVDTSWKQVVARDKGWKRAAEEDTRW